MQVIAGGVSGAKSAVSFATPTVPLGGTDVVTIAVSDSDGNPITGLASSAFSFALSGGRSAGTFGTVSAAATPGTYTVIFTGTRVGTASKLTTKVSGVTLDTKPTVRVVADKVSGAKSTIGVATPTAAVGSTDVITIDVKNNGGDPITGLASSAFRFALARGKSAGRFGTVSATPTPGIYTVVFTGTKTGTASTFTATVRGVRLKARPRVRVVASAISSRTPQNIAGFRWG